MKSTDLNTAEIDSICHELSYQFKQWTAGEIILWAESASNLILQKQRAQIINRYVNHMMGQEAGSFDHNVEKKEILRDWLHGRVNSQTKRKVYNRKKKEYT